jgi:hypothetical protein
MIEGSTVTEQVVEKWNKQPWPILTCLAADFSGAEQ